MNNRQAMTRKRRWLLTGALVLGLGAMALSVAWRVREATLDTRVETRTIHVFHAASEGVENLPVELAAGMVLSTDGPATTRTAPCEYSFISRPYESPFGSEIVVFRGVMQQPSGRVGFRDFDGVGIRGTFHVAGQFSVREILRESHFRSRPDDMIWFSTIGCQPWRVNTPA